MPGVPFDGVVVTVLPDVVYVPDSVLVLGVETSWQTQVVEPVHEADWYDGVAARESPNAAQVKLASAMHDCGNVYVKAIDASEAEA